MFFEPLTVTHCDVQYNDNGRHTGEADAFFGSYDDAQEAMKRHKQKMGARQGFRQGAAQLRPDDGAGLAA